MTIHRRLQRRFIIVGVLIFVVGLIASSGQMHDKMEDIIAWAESAISQAPYFGMAIFVLLAMVSAMVAFFSCAVLAPVAVYTWGRTVTFVLLWLGWLLGGVTSYCIARFFGRKVASLLIDEEQIASWERQVGERARFRHILLFQAVVPSEVPGFVLGTLRYRFIYYLIALAITELPYVIAVVYLGDSFLKGESAVFLLLGVAAIALGVSLVQIHKKMARAVNEKEADN